MGILVKLRSTLILRIGIRRLAFLITLFQIGIANSQELSPRDYQRCLERLGLSVRGHRLTIEVKYKNMDIPSPVTLEISSEGGLVSKTHSILSRNAGKLRTQNMNCLITPEFRFIRTENLIEGESFRQINNIAWLAVDQPEGYSLGATVVPVPELLVFDRFSEKYWHEIISLPDTVVRVVHSQTGFETLISESKEFGTAQFKFSGSKDLKLESIRIEKSGTQLGVEQERFSRYAASIEGIVTSSSNEIQYIESISDANESYVSSTDGDIKVHRSIRVLSRDAITEEFSEKTILSGYGVREEEDVDVRNNRGVLYRVRNGKPIKMYFPETDVPAKNSYFRNSPKSVVVWGWLIGLILVLGFVSLRLHAKIQAR